MILRTTSIAVLFLAQCLLACGDGDGTEEESEDGVEEEDGGVAIEAALATADLAALVCEASASCECRAGPAEASSCVDAIAPAIAGGVTEGQTLGLLYHPECLTFATAYAEALGCRRVEEAAGDDELFQLQWEAQLCKPLAGDGALADPCFSMGEVGFLRLGDTCAQGLTCVNSLCVQLLQDTGALCAHGFCPPGHECSDPDADGIRTCEPFPGAGDSCNPHTSACPADLLCDPVLRVCADPPGPGQACPQGRCTADSICVNAVCEPFAGDGAPCGAVGCASGLRCDFNTNTCAPRLGASEPCFFSDDCAEGLTCDQLAAVCVALPGEGQECSVGLCASGLQCNFDNTCEAPPAVTCQLPFCLYRFDDLCDEPEGTGYCQEGTDPEDCELEM